MSLLFLSLLPTLRLLPLVRRLRRVSPGLLRLSTRNAPRPCSGRRTRPCARCLRFRNDVEAVDAAAVYALQSLCRGAFRVETGECARARGLGSLPARDQKRIR